MGRPRKRLAASKPKAARKLFSTTEILEELERPATDVFDEDEVIQEINNTSGAVLISVEDEPANQTNPETSITGNAEVVKTRNAGCQLMELLDLEKHPGPSSGVVHVSSAEDDSDIADGVLEQDRMPKKGRKRENVWTEFETIYDENTGAIKSNRCKICRKSVSAKAIRMKVHLSKCAKQNRLKRVEAPASLQNTSSTTAKLADSVTTPKSAQPLDAIGFKGFTIWKRASEISAKAEIDQTIGKFIFSANLPFSVAENPFLKEIIMRKPPPNYKPPSRRRISSSILNEVYDESAAKFREELKDAKVIILQDGWSTSQNDPVICHSIHSGKRSLLFDAVDAEANRKTADYCSGLLERAIETAEREFECNVIGVVTDNCNVMKALRRIFSEKYPQLFAYGCMAHYLNLLGQDLSDDNLLEDISKVQKFFRNHHFESAALKSAQGNRPKIPGKTRWNSQVDTLESYKKNHLLYLQIARDPNSTVSTSPDIMSILIDGNRYLLAEQQIKLLKPVAVALDKVQAEACSLSDAVKYWKDLHNLFALNERVEDIFAERSNVALDSIAIAAYMLNPKYRGENLAMEEEEKGFDLIRKLNPFLCGLTCSLKSLDFTVFPKHLLMSETISTMDSAAWWRAVAAYTSIAPSAINICENLMLLPASTASIERAFSTMGNIMTKKRNRLGIEQARKLCVINKQLRSSQNLLEDSDSDDCND